MKNSKRVGFFIALLFLLITNNSFSQSTTDLGTYLTTDEAYKLYTDTINRHTSIRPYVHTPEDGDLEPQVDDTTYKDMSWFKRKLYHEHLAQVRKGDEYSLYFDFLPDFQVGQDGNKMTWLNTRGFLVGGKVGKKFKFYTSFYENQGSVPGYVDDRVNSTFVPHGMGGMMPGQGEARVYADGTAWDYAYVTSRLSYSPSKYLNIEGGYDKNFIGDGYRSLILSDAATPYPFLKTTATVWKLRYMMMWSQFLDRESEKLSYQQGYRKKWGAFHYLDWAISSKFSIGIFENVMWMDADEKGKRGFDWTYANPLLFFRPAEFAHGSPDKMLLGLTTKYKVLPKVTLYGQFILNEFTADEFFSGSGYWANKWGAQTGMRTFDILGIKKLHWQTEMNAVRPYTYTARSAESVDGGDPTAAPTNNYNHASEPLAHPWGANFIEYLNIVQYSWRKWELRAQYTYGLYGLDTEGTNYGKDIRKPYDTREADYGNKIGQGLTTHLNFFDFKIGYIINPKYNLKFEIGYIYRDEDNAEWHTRSNYITFGLRSSFRNLYQDY